MPYTGQAWIDGVTPLDNAHMAALDAGVVGAVDVDNVVAAASQLVANKLLAGDAQPAFKILGDGTQSWGPGGATAPDVSLYRSATSTLVTDGAFIARPGTVGQVRVSPISGTPLIDFGNPADTNLYRSSADNLKTDNTFWVAKRIVVNSGDTAGWGLLFGSALDTNLYRWTVGGYLKTDGSMLIAKGLWINHGDGAGNKINFGSAGDTNIYRSAAAELSTDSLLRVNGSGAGVGSSGYCGLLLNFMDVGQRWVRTGNADSGGAGSRVLIVNN